MITRVSVFFLFAIFIIVSATNAFAYDCANGAVVSEDKLSYICDLFVPNAFVAPGSRKVDERIIKRFPPSGQYDPPIRSFAVVVSVSSYPKAIEKEDQRLAAVDVDLTRLISFLKDQQFDEIILLKNESATSSRIEDVLKQYIYPLVKGPYRGRSRFFFSYDGHGVYGDDPSLPGGMALSNSIGENDTNPSRSFPLSQLRDRLEEIASFAYQSVALLGSCYSGSIFPRTVISNTYDSNSSAPGAHVVTASTRSERAWTGPEGHGTVFFEEMIDAVENAQPTPSDITVSTVSDAGGASYPLSKQIVRLPSAVLAVNSDLEDKINPVTLQHYPFLQMAQMAPNKGYEGTFFFLGKAPRLTAAGAKAASPIAGGEAETGSSIVGRPDLKVFNPPEYYKIRGVDLSRANKNVDIEKLPMSGINFVYLKATQGKISLDPEYSGRQERARRVGLSVGAYHVFSFCDDPMQQLRNIKNNIKTQSKDLPLALDVEWFEGPGILRERNCNNKDIIRSNLRQVADGVAEMFGKKPIIYTSARGVKALLADKFNDIPLWVARWQRPFGGFGPSLTGDNPWTFWQYTDRGHVDGIIGKVDVNLFFGSEEQFNQFASGKTNVALTAATQ